MKVILVSRKHGGSRSLELGRWSRAFLSLCCLGMPLGLVAVGYQMGAESVAQNEQGASLEGMAEELASQAEEVVLSFFGADEPRLSTSRASCGP